MFHFVVASNFVRVTGDLLILLTYDEYQTCVLRLVCQQYVMVDVLGLLVRVYQFLTIPLLFPYWSLNVQN